MLDKAIIGRVRPQHPPAGQKLIMAEHLIERTIISCQRQPEPGVDAATNFDHAANRFAALKSSRKTQRIAFTMGAGDFGKPHPAYFDAEDLSKSGAGDTEPAFACLIDLHDGDTRQSAAQRARIDIVSCHAAFAIATRLPVLDQHLLGVGNTRKNILLTHNSPPPR